MQRSNRSGLTGMYCSDGDTVELFSESNIPSNFTAEQAEKNDMKYLNTLCNKKCFLYLGINAIIEIMEKGNKCWIE